MSLLFRAKTEEGYTVKILSELLQNIIRLASFEITPSGVLLRMMDGNRRTLVDIVMEASNFKVYELHSNTMFIGINLAHLHRMLKSMKKKDTLTMSIHASEPDQLRLEVCPKDRSLVTVSYVHIKQVQNIQTPLPTGYGNPVNIMSAEYQRSMKDLGSIDDKIRITMYPFAVKFCCSVDKLFSREVLLGESDNVSEVILFDDIFETEQLMRIQKMSGLGNNLKIYGTPGQALMMQSDIGGLGTVSIYIKPYEASRNELMNG